MLSFVMDIETCSQLAIIQNFGDSTLFFQLHLELLFKEIDWQLLGVMVSNEK